LSHALLGATHIRGRALARATRDALQDGCGGVLLRAPLGATHIRGRTRARATRSTLQDSCGGVLPRELLGATHLHGRARACATRGALHDSRGGVLSHALLSATHCCCGAHRGARVRRHAEAVRDGGGVLQRRSTRQVVPGIRRAQLSRGGHQPRGARCFRSRADASEARGSRGGERHKRRRRRWRRRTHATTRPLPARSRRA
jgi:hypothetical protein